MSGDSTSYRQGTSLTRSVVYTYGLTLHSSVPPLQKTARLLLFKPEFLKV